MMSADIWVLSLSAASLGFVHTVLGPDHYIPFIVLAKARKWNYLKTMWITALCGIGHVGSSIVIGVIGIAAGFGLNHVTGIESMRGSIAGWAISLFGLFYLAWGFYRIVKKKPHKHLHFHDGHVHAHEHTHEDHDHDHVHKPNVTPWILFLIFILGPCEPLIPMLMYPAAELNAGGIATVSTVFSIVTIATMMTMTSLVLNGLSFINLNKIQKYSHAIAGAIILLTGIGILFLGL